MATSEYAHDPAIIARLGTVPDRVIAEECRVSIRAVGQWRRMHGIRAYLPERPWTTEEVAVLGTAPDAEVARWIHRTRRAVKGKRQKLDIEAMI